MVSGTGHKAAVLGAGSWGTALAIHLGSVGHDVALWGRDRPDRRDGRAAGESDLSARHHVSELGAAERGRWPTRSPVRATSSSPCRRTGCAASFASAAPHIPRGRGARQRDQGHRNRLAAADVGGHPRGDRRAASGRRVVGSELCGRGRAPAADRARRGVRRRGRGGVGAGRVSRARPSGSTDRTTSSASRSARRSRTSSRSRPA